MYLKIMEPQMVKSKEKIFLVMDYNNYTTHETFEKVLKFREKKLEFPS